MFQNLAPYSNIHEMNLDWILKEMKDLKNEWVSMLDKLSGYAYEELVKRVERLEKLIGEFEQTLLDDVEAQIPELVEKYLKIAIFVSITPEGFFQISIPSTWRDIEFGTTELDHHVDGYDYGHLVLYY